MKTLSRLARWKKTTPTTYVLIDRLHLERCVRVTADDIVPVVSSWLTPLGVRTRLTEEFARTVADGDWIAVRALCETLSVDISVAT